MVQAFVDQSDPDSNYTATINEDNLVNRIGQLIRIYQRQQDRISNMVDGMKKIASGD
jgi:hypothetical protein